MQNMPIYEALAQAFTAEGGCFRSRSLHGFIKGGTGFH